MLLDVRCPKCNRPVNGKPNDDVLIYKRLPKPVAKCPHCGLEITRVKTPDEGLGECYHYESTNPNGGSS